MGGCGVHPYCRAIHRAAHAPLRPPSPEAPIPAEYHGAAARVMVPVELVVNANASGAGGADDVAARATDALRAAGAPVRARLTADERDLADAVRVAGDARLVLVGGDGTVHALANVDLPVLPPVALLPAGRANNIARALGIPADWARRGVASLSRDRPARVDALHVVTPERRLFAVEGVSAGFHAAARHRYDGTNSADLVAGVAALAAELRVVPAARGRSCASTASAFVDGPAGQVFLSQPAVLRVRLPRRPGRRPVRRPCWRRSSSTRERGGTSSGRSRAARTGRHLRPPGHDVAARRTSTTSSKPLPLVADARAARRHDGDRHGRRRPPAPRRTGGADMTASAAALRPRVPHVALSALWAFATVAVALGAARAVTTTYVPVLLERIADRPGLIGAVMLVNAVGRLRRAAGRGAVERPAWHARAVHPRRRARRGGRSRRGGTRQRELVRRPRAGRGDRLRRPERGEHGAPGARRRGLRRRRACRGDRRAGGRDARRRARRDRRRRRADRQLGRRALRALGARPAAARPADARLAAQRPAPRDDRRARGGGRLAAAHAGRGPAPRRGSARARRAGPVGRLVRRAHARSWCSTPRTCSACARQAAGDAAGRLRRADRRSACSRARGCRRSARGAR